MRTAIFKKAEGLKVIVIEDGSIRGKSYYTFKDTENPPLITLACNGKYTYLESCTCTHHSIYGGGPKVDMKNLCSYVIAVYKVLPLK